MKTRFLCINTHPVIQVDKLEHTPTPAPFIVTYIDFKKHPTLPDLKKAKSCFTIPTQASNSLHPFKTQMFTSYIQIIFYTLLCNIFPNSHAVPFKLQAVSTSVPSYQCA